MKNKDYKTIHVITPETDEEYDMLQEILSESRKRLPMLEAMTKEERIEYFRKGLFSRKLDFDLVARSFTSIPTLTKNPKRTSLIVFAECRTK